MTTRRQTALLVAFCALLYVPGVAVIQLYSRGEAREALALREVVQSGQWVVPMRPDGKLTRKPPLFYWAGMLTSRALPGLPEGALRLPSVLAGTTGVLATALLGSAAIGPMAMGAALMLATSIEWIRAATSGRVDMLLSAAMTLVLLGWTARLAGRPARSANLLVALGTALAVLAKGPIGAGFPAAALVLTAFIHRDRALLRLLLPLLAGTAAAALWYVAAWLSHGRVFLDIVLAENLGRFVDTTAARTGHEHGPLYVLVGLIGLLPWTPLLPLMASAGTARPHVRTLLLAWIVTIVAVVTISASKRSVYLLPIFPAVALLVANGLTTAPSPRLTRVLRVTTALYAPLFTLVALLLLVVTSGIDVTGTFAPALASEDRRAIRVIENVLRGARAPVVTVVLALLLLALASRRARAAGLWTQLVPPVAGAVALLTIALQLGIHPAIAESRGFAAFMPLVATLVPPDESLHAYFPVDPSVRFYAPRPVVDWKQRPADRDVYLLAWEREVEAFRPDARVVIERLAISDARHGSRGALVLVRVPRGTLPSRRVPSVPRQNG
jgi:4-amino-4-deoxy-L-arabinose transferase-like glycosyltransferase